MRRSPLQQFGDMVGMYAYLAAMGGLRYWPAIRRASVEEQPFPASVEIEEPGRDLVSASQYEYTPRRERTPAA